MFSQREREETLELSKKSTGRPAQGNILNAVFPGQVAMDVQAILYENA